MQAQDMGKVGAMQDLLRGIKKILPKETSPVVQQVTQVVQSGANVNSLLQRVFIFLEDGDWQSADEYCEKILDIDPQNAEAYLGKLMVELQVRDRENLGTQKEPFDYNANYQKVMRYSSETIRQEVKGYIEQINDRKEQERQKSICMSAAKKIKSAKTVEEYDQVKQMLIPIRSLKDAEVLIAKCDEAISAIEARCEPIYQKASEMAASGDYFNAIIIYSSILNCKDTSEKINECVELSRNKKQQQQEKINTIKRQQEDTKKEFNVLNSKLAILRKNNQHMTSCRDSLRKSREDQRTLIQQRDSLASELSGLGVFAFSKKKQLQADINYFDAQLAQIANTITDLDNGTDYDAVIRKCQTEIETVNNTVTVLRQTINALQKDIDIVQTSMQNSIESIEFLEFGIKMNSVLILPQDLRLYEEMEMFKKEIEIQKYIKSNNISEVIIPDGVTFIGERAFSGCSSLTAIIIPDSVTSIGEWAFSECTSLTSIVIPDSVTRIGDCAFKECSSLTSIVIPDSVTSIGIGAFYKCSSLTSIVIPDSITSIGGDAFNGCASLTNITIPDNVTGIKPRTFDRCSSLTTVVIPKNAKFIGDKAFLGCKKLTSIVIPENVKFICKNAFLECKRLTSVIIPDSVTSIGDGAFEKCSGLISVAISESVTSIGKGAFLGCSNLTIKGKKGSYAETYAMENKIPFSAI